MKQPNNNNNNNDDELMDLALSIAIAFSKHKIDNEGAYVPVSSYATLIYPVLCAANTAKCQRLKLAIESIMENGAAWSCLTKEQKAELRSCLNL